MYTEFIIIFAGLGLIIALLIVIMILLIIMMKRSSGNLPAGVFTTPISVPPVNVSPVTSNQQSPPVSKQPFQGGGVVFCKNCYTQFDSSVQFCPKCGTPRT